MKKQISNGWQTKRLDEVATVTMGQSPASSSYNSQGTGVPFLQGMPSVVDNMGTVVPQLWTTEPTKVVGAGTALMTVRAPVGELFTTNDSICLGRGLAGIRANNDISQIYLNYYLQFSKNQLNTYSQGSTFTAINSDSLKSIPVVFPSFTQQEYIGNALITIDKVIARTNQLIQKTKLLRQGLMKELLTRGIGHKKFKKTRLGEIPEEWLVKSFVDISEESKERNENELLGADLIMGVTKAYGLIPMKERIKGKDIKRYKTVKKNYFAYNPMRLNIGSIARWHEERTILVSPDYVVFSPKMDLVLSDYMDYLRQSFLWSSFTKRSGDGSVRIRIYYSHLSPLYFPLPSLNEQRKIVDVLKSIDEKLSIEKRGLVQLQNLKAGIMQDIFNQKVQIN